MKQLTNRQVTFAVKAGTYLAGLLEGWLVCSSEVSGSKLGKVGHFLAHSMDFDRDLAK